MTLKLPDLYDDEMTFRNKVAQWLLSLVNNRRTPESYGARGDGVTDDTSAITAWLGDGGGEALDEGKTYLIDPIILTSAARVYCAPGVTFKLRSGWSNWNLLLGMITATADLTWHGGTFDGARAEDYISGATSGLVTVLKPGTVNEVRNKYKAGIGVGVTTADITIDIQDVTFVNQVNYGLVCIASDDYVIDGYVDNIVVKDSGSACRFDRVRNLRIGDLYAFDIDNRPRATNDLYFPANQHVFQMIRSEDSPVRSLTVDNVKGRAGEYGTSKGPFINAVTWSTNRRCPIQHVRVNEHGATMGTATDHGGDTIREVTSLLGVSWVSNDSRTWIENLYFYGTATQGIEAIADEDTFFGNVVLISDGGEQNVLSGSAAINSHGEARPAESAGSGSHKRQARIHINNLTVRGQWHYGIWARKNIIEIDYCSIRECRADGIMLNNSGASEYVGAAAQKPSLFIHEADICLNGGNGIRVVNGGRCEVYAGRISDNCQRSGYDDATLTDSAFTRTHAVAYDSADANAGTVDQIIIHADVHTDALYSAVTGGAMSFMPGAPVQGSDTTVPEPNLYYGFATFTDPSAIHLGMRLTLKGLDSGDLVGWPVASDGDVFLIELDDADKAVTWVAGSTTNLSGTWDHTQGDKEVTGTSGNLDGEVAGPTFISTPHGVVMLQNIIDDDEFEISLLTEWGATAVNTLNDDLSGETIATIDGTFDYAVSQTATYSISHANVTTSYAGSVLSLSVTNNVDIGGTLEVTGNTTLGGALEVTGATTLSGAATVDDLTIGGDATVEGRFYTGIVSIDDDSFTQITPPTTSGILICFISNSAAMIRYSTSAPQVEKLVGTSTIEVTTGALTGTTGTNSVVTVSPDSTSGTIYVENRRTNGLQFRYLFLT